tara:strand:+ start:50 stop:1573 length:1524 start_codon:yes stop_codon:yes gene_type:complete
MLIKEKKPVDLLSRRLTIEEFDILKRASKDPFFFSLFVKIIHPIKGKVPFNLYEYQKAVLRDFLQHRFNIVLKFRQAGLTELIAMFCLWYAMYQPFKNIQIISIKDRVAKRVLRRIKGMYLNLPDYLKQPVVNGRSSDIGTATEVEFANGSIITSIPTTEEAGRSEAVSLLVIDEAAIVRWMGTIWASAFPTLSTGGRAIINSTPYGVGNWYHKTWVDAVSGGSHFNAIRLRWQMHPERDQDWYNGMSAELGARRTAQEIDGDFLASGLTVFDLQDIKALEDLLPDHKPLRTIHVRGDYRIKIYKEPEKNENYFVGGDVSTGRANDSSAFTVLNSAGEEYASFKGKIPTSELAKQMGNIGMLYNQATIAPESNDIGAAVTDKLQEDSYPNLYYTKTFIKQKKQSKRKEETKVPGWYTTKKNRPVIIDGLEEDIRRQDIIIKDPDFIREAYTFIYDHSNRPVAMGKGKKSSAEDDMEEQVYSDDSIMGKSITNYIRKNPKSTVTVLPK